MWVPELLDCILSLEDLRGGAEPGKKNGKKQEKDERRARALAGQGENFCAGLLCWGGWQCPAMPQVPCPAGGVGRGTGTPQRAHAPKEHAADNLSQGAGCCRRSELERSCPSLNASKLAIPSQVGISLSQFRRSWQHVCLVLLGKHALFQKEL